MNPWPQLVVLDPEQREDLVEKIFTEYGQGFKPLSVDAKAGIVTVELQDGRKVQVKV